MTTSVRTNWRALKRGKPGQRFKDAYEKAHRRRKETPLWFRVLRLGLAVVTFAIGAVFAVIPGPAFLFFILSGLLLASESKSVAMLLDWLELRLHAVGKWAKRRWDRMGLPGRIMVVLAGAAVSAGMTTVTILIFFRR